jgi:hypothetical protein
VEALGINGGYFLVQLINFAIIFIVIRTWVVIPVVGLLEKRRETIARGLEDARVAAEARANADKDASKIMAEAQLKANEVVGEASKRAEAAAQDIAAGKCGCHSCGRAGQPSRRRSRPGRFAARWPPHGGTAAGGRCLDEKRQRS